MYQHPMKKITFGPSKTKPKSPFSLLDARQVLAQRHAVFHLRTYGYCGDVAVVTALIDR